MSQIQRQYFGTDGVRGPFGGPVINEIFAARLGIAAARFAKTGRVLIGRDTRESGPPLQKAVAAGLASAGMEPVILDVIPTPALAMAVVAEGASLGIMVTASHNPATDNGIKFFNASGLKLTDAQEIEIESLLGDESTARDALARFASRQGTPQTQPPPAIGELRAYLDKMTSVLPARALDGWSIVLDAANGATCVTSPRILASLGAKLTLLGNEPDGRNINAGVGSEHPQPLAARVRETGARFGIAHDGDGDRCVLCDELGEVLDGDEILTLLALHALRQGKLAASTLVVTVHSNLGVDAAVRAAGGKVVRSNVGDRYVAEKMRENGATLGGESSGHIIYSEISSTGDGLLAALKVLEVMLATGKPLSELRQGLKKFPQATINLRVREKIPLARLPKLSAAIAALEHELGDRGRVLVRYSGTEAKLRLLVEGPSDAIVRAGAETLESAARSELETTA
ncbi:phosphoglucosamine mutase [Ereboglobus luteus]|uniref:phosphoglucosamine mutase n=1 Tax=Ereboglobus luteus TaxID=1796921 RepID=UPI001F01C900|nr:phosphoglucosamine mutase [Ereboglobus luteus]